ncbi:MAG: hypothetical protein RR393_07630 [Bacteroidales bacterium]
MKKIFIVFVCFFTLSYIGLEAQVLPNVWMVKSDLSKGKTVKFAVSGVSKIEVDFGDHALVTKDNLSLSDFTEISGEWLGDTLQIYADGILGLKIQQDTLSLLNVAKCSSLLHLEVSNARLEAINISSLSKLKYLDLSGNNLSSISLTKCKYLEYLDLSANKLTDLNINNNDSLRYLNASQNKLTSLDLAYSQKLKVLKVFKNMISSIYDLGEAVSLEEFNFSSNAMTTINLKKQISLKSLYCEKNKLSVLNLANNANLKKVYCANNQISSCVIPNMFACDTLDCKNNHLDFLSLASILAAVKTGELIYAPQLAVDVKPALYQGDTIDLNRYYRVLAPDGLTLVTTQFGMKNNLGSSLVEGTDYISDSGRLVLLKDFGRDSVYVVMSNTEYPQFVDKCMLRTNAIRVRPPFVLRDLAAVMSLEKGKGNMFTIGLTGFVVNEPVQVDFGNGEIVEWEVKKGPMGQTIINGELQGDTVKIYGALNGIIVTGQNLTSIRLEKGSKDLFVINCGNNLLESLDVSVCEKLQVLQCPNNYLHFSTIPSKTASIKNYVYAPQWPIPVKGKYYTKDTLELSEITQGEMHYVWKTDLDTILVEGVDYLSINGKFIFLNAQKDSVHGEITSSIFPDLNGVKILQTEKFKAAGAFVLQPLAVLMVGQKKVGETMFLGLTGNITNTPIQVDFGDGQLMEYEVKKGPMGQTPINGVVGGDTIKIYGNLMGLIVTNQSLTSIHLDTGSKDLFVINCERNKINYLDISKSKALKVFQCPGNALDFTTLPVISNDWQQKNYAPQALVSIPEQWFTDSVLDLSAHAICKNALGEQVSTVFTWKNVSGKILEESIDYTNDGGKFKFLKPQDSIYVIFSNEAYPLFAGPKALRSTYIKKCKELIQPPLALSFSCKKQIGDTLKFSLVIPISTTATSFWCDYGNGSLEIEEWEAGVTNIELKKSLLGKKVKIYTNAIDSLFIKNMKLDSVEIAANSGLLYLNIAHNEIRNLNIKNLSSLRYLDASFNDIEFVCLSDSLKYMDISDNKLNFHTLPPVNSNRERYIYAPQKNLDIRKSIVEWDTLDMSVLGTKAKVMWKTEKDSLLYNLLDYFSDSSLYRFAKVYPYGIHAEISHPDFPDFSGKNIWKTTSLVVTPASYSQQNILVEMNTSLSIGSVFSILVLPTEKYALFQMDRGDGKIKTFHLTDSVAVKDTIMGENIKIYTSSISLLHVNNLGLNQLKVYDNLLLEDLDCSNNLLKLSDLPVKGNNWIRYTYAPQSAYALSPINGNTIDLSAFYSLKGVSSKNEITNYTWVCKNKETLKLGIDYSQEKGIFTFLHSMKDSIYCVLSTEAFPDFKDTNAYKTSCIYVQSISNEDKVTIVGEKEISFSVQDRTLYVKNLSFGDILRITDIQGRNPIYEKIIGDKLTKAYNLPQGIYILQLNKSYVKLLIH